jgi:hypothetical protein
MRDGLDEAARCRFPTSNMAQPISLIGSSSTFFPRLVLDSHALSQLDLPGATRPPCPVGATLCSPPSLLVLPRLWPPMPYPTGDVLPYHSHRPTLLTPHHAHGAACASKQPILHNLTGTSPPACIGAPITYMREGGMAAHCNMTGMKRDAPPYLQFIWVGSIPHF